VRQKQTAIQRIAVLPNGLATEGQPRVSSEAGQRSAETPASGGAGRSGALLFGYFLLGEQEKVTGCRAAPGFRKGSPKATVCCLPIAW